MSHHSTGRHQPRLPGTVLSAVLTAILIGVGNLRAEVIFDGSLGVPGAVVGPDYRINADRGRQVGSNLFHSFSQFNLTHVESATFNGTPDISNVISRVTGGNLSSIDGRLNVDIPKANFYLINPAGVVLGPNATLNIDGAFNVSTAHYVLLENGGRFDVMNPQQSVLNVGNPVAYGFLDADIAGVIIEGAQLQTAGYSMSITGGEIQVEGSAINTQGGDMRLVAVSGPGTVTMGQGELAAGTAPLTADITIANVSQVSTSGNTAGSVYIRGGKLVIDNGQVTAASDGSSEGGIIDVSVSTLEMNNGSELSSSTSSNALAGDISVNAAEKVLIQSGSVVTTDTSGNGDAGDIEVIGKEIDLIDGAKISSSSTGSGDGGLIDLNAMSDVVLAGEQTGLFADTFGTGDGGSIKVSGRVVHIKDGASVTTKTILVGEGAEIGTTSSVAGTGGSITLTSEKLIRLSEKSSISAASFGDGDAGDIHFESSLIEILGGSRVTTSTGAFVESPACSGVACEALIQPYEPTYGNGGAITLIGERVTLSDGVFWEPHSFVYWLETNGYDAFLEQYQLYRIAPGFITGYISTLAPEEQAAFINTANTLWSSWSSDGELREIRDTVASENARLPGGLYSTSYSEGNGGDIRIQADVVEIQGKARVSSETTKLLPDIDDDFNVRFDIPKNGSDAGNIEIVADSVDIASSDQRAVTIVGTSGFNYIPNEVQQATPQAGLYAGATNTTGVAGHIDINAHKFTIRSGAVLDSNTENAGASGDIRIDSNTIVAQGSETSISASTKGNGEGGSIALNSSERILLSKQAKVTTSSTGNGNAGDVSMSSKVIEIASGARVETSTGRPPSRTLFDFGLGFRGAPYEPTKGEGGDITLIAEEVKIADELYWEPNTFEWYLKENGQLELLTTLERVGADTNYFDALPSDEQQSIESLVLQLSEQWNIDTDSIRSRIETENFTRPPSALSASSYAEGDAGDITVTASDITILGRGRVETESSKPYPVGFGTIDGRKNGSDGGAINLVADTITISSHGLRYLRPYTRTNIWVSVVDLPGREGALPILDHAGLYASADKTTGNSGDITIDSGEFTLENGAQIRTSSLDAGVGGNITVNSSFITIDGTDIEGELTVNGLTVDALAEAKFSSIRAETEDNLFASGNAGRITLNADEIDILDGAQLSTASRGSGYAGNIDLTASTLRLSNGAEIESSALSSGSAGNISISAHDTFSMTGVFEYLGDIQIQNANNPGINRIFYEYNVTGQETTVSRATSIAATTSGEGDGGAISITGGRFDLSDGAYVSTTTTSSGLGGTIDVSLSGDLTISGVDAGLLAETGGTGASGGIVVSGESVSLSDSARISSSSGQAGGDAGSIGISAGSFIMDSASGVSASTEGDGAGGNVLIDSSLIVVDGEDTTISAVSKGSGAGGVIELTGNDISIQSDASLSSQAESSGSAGSITISAQGDVAVIGPQTTISASTEASGDAGVLTIEAANITFSDGANATTLTRGSGNGGPITLEATNIVRLTGQGAGVLAESFGHGTGGKIRVVGNQVAIQNGASLSSASHGEGEGGTVTIEADERVVLAGSGTAVTTESDNSANGGNISIVAEELFMSGGAEVRASNTGGGDAGDIHVEIGDSIRLRDSRILTEASAGSGGSITLLTTELLELNRSELSTSVLGADGNGGNIFVDPYLVLMQNSRVTANAVFGNGGSIEIHAGLLTVDANTVLSASSQFGVDGDVVVDAPILPLQNTKRLPEKTDRQLLRSRCMASRSEVSSFTIAGGSITGYMPDRSLAVTHSDYLEPSNTNIADPVQVAMSCGQ